MTTKVISSDASGQVPASSSDPVFEVQHDMDDLKKQPSFDMSRADSSSSDEDVAQSSMELGWWSQESASILQRRRQSAEVAGKSDESQESMASFLRQHGLEQYLPTLQKWTLHDLRKMDKEDVVDVCVKAAMFKEARLKLLEALGSGGRRPSLRSASIAQRVASEEQPAIAGFLDYLMNPLANFKGCCCSGRQDTKLREELKQLRDFREELQQLRVKVEAQT